MNERKQTSLKEKGGFYLDLYDSRLKCRRLTPAHSQRTATADREKVA